MWDKSLKWKVQWDTISHSPELQKLKVLTILSIDQDMSYLNSHLWWESDFEKYFDISYKHLTYFEIFTREMKTYVHQFCEQMFIANLVILLTETTQMYKNCEWETNWCMYTLEYYSPVNKNKLQMQPQHTWLSKH